MEYSNFQREDFSEWNIQEETLQGTLEAIFFNNFFFFFFSNYPEGLWDCSLAAFQQCLFEVEHWPFTGNVREISSGVAKWKVEYVFLKTRKVSENTLGHVVRENRLEKAVKFILWV